MPTFSLCQPPRGHPTAGFPRPDEPDNPEVTSPVTPDAADRARPSQTEEVSRRPEPYRADRCRRVTPAVGALPDEPRAQREPPPPVGALARPARRCRAFSATGTSPPRRFPRCRPPQASFLPTRPPAKTSLLKHVCERLLRPPCSPLRAQVRGHDTLFAIFLSSGRRNTF